MDRRLTIQRETRDALSARVAALLGATLARLRGDIPEAIKAMVAELDVNRPAIPEHITPSTLYSESHINDCLDAVYLDLAVQYIDAFGIENALYKINHFFDSTVIPIAVKAGELSSRSRALEMMSSGYYSFTDAIHESFNASSNYATSDKKLRVSPGAGIITLPGTREEYGRPEKTNVSLSPVTRGCRIIDESDVTNVYNVLPAEPYFINVLATEGLTNPAYLRADFSSYRGLLVDVIIQFPSIVPVNNVRFAPFSTAPIEIVGLYYSTSRDTGWNDAHMTRASLGTISYDNPEVELNFDRVYARELHVVIHQQDFVTAKGETTIVECRNTTEYIQACTEGIRNMLPDGFNYPEHIPSQVSEIVQAVHRAVEFPTETIEPSTRSYVVGLYNLSVNNMSYQSYGEYQAKPWSIRGCLASMSVNYEGDIARESDNDTIDCCTLFAARIGGRDIYLGDTADGKVIDAVVIHPNRTLNDGVWSVDDEHPYRFETHFIPDVQDGDELGGFDVYYNGELHSIESGAVGVHTDYSTIVKITRELADAMSVREGSIVTMQYPVPDYDRYGNLYDPASADVFKRLGKPNIVENSVIDIDEQYLFVPDGDGFISYGPSEYFPVTIDDSLYYCIGDGKGETLPSEGKQVINGVTYVSGMVCSGPYDGLYCGVVAEEPELMESGVVLDGHGDTYFQYRTLGSYAKGTLKVRRSGYIVNEVVQYDDDELGTVLSMDEKRVLYVAESAMDPDDEISVSYIPIVETDELSSLVTTNIATHNHSERFTGTEENKVSLSRYPYLDRDIVNSDKFGLRDGVFVYLPKFSITYEPVVVYVNGIKAVNVTDYRGNTARPPEFGEIRRQTEYKFYVDQDNNVVFDRPITGNIMVYYYVLSDSLQFRVEMYRSNYYRNDLTPELHDFTALVNLQR